MEDAVTMGLAALFFVGAFASSLKTENRDAQVFFVRCVMWLMVVLMCVALYIQKGMI